jgi:hypothetical protein
LLLVLLSDLEPKPRLGLELSEHWTPNLKNLLLLVIIVAAAAAAIAIREPARLVVWYGGFFLVFCL